MDSLGLAWVKLVGCCEDSNEPLGSGKYRNFLNGCKTGNIL